jgi:monoamine oxidase
MNFLRRLGRRQQAAEHYNLPIEALAEHVAAQRPRLAGLTRRDFLRNAAMAAAGLALSHRVSAKPGHSRLPRIAIVGAGISGLNCALTLADKGLQADLYEASGRLGGRMFSNNQGYWSDGQVSEWCGELIDSGHETIQYLAARFGLTLDDLLASEPDHSEETYFFTGQYYPRAAAVQDFQPVYQALQDDANAADYPTTYNQSTAAGRQLDKQSVWEWIRHRVPGAHASNMGQLLDTAYAIEYGADTRDQSALNLVYLLSGSDQNFEIFGASDEHYHIRGGNQQLPLAIANYLAGLGMPVQTGRYLAAIRQRADGAYRLTFEGESSGDEVVADLVVLTLPFAVLRTLDYQDAGFNNLKHTAIQELGRGHNGKLQLQFSQRGWAKPGPRGVGNGSSYADTGYQNTWEVTRAQKGDSGILNDYTGGSVTDQMHTRTAFARVPHQGVQLDSARFLFQVASVFPGLAPLWNGKATQSLPHLSPVFNCAYSYWRVGQYQRFAGYEAVRQQNVFFAGEHTSVDFQGYMEGAAMEGARAAQEILGQLGLV